MKYRMLTFLAFAFAAAALAIHAAEQKAGGQVAASAARPNIVFILVDDLGWADFSCFGNETARTPNLDRLSEEGLRFHQFYVASPICSPSRCGFLTGQYPARWRLTSYLDNRAKNEERGMVQWLDPQAPSLARLLQRAGYVTGHFGKWHLGGQRDVGEAPLITEYGFSESLTQFEGLGDRVLALLDNRDGKPPRKMPLGLGSEKLGRGNITWLDRAQVTGAFVSRAVDFIHQAEAAGKPFFVNIWPDDVHSPFFPTKELRGNATKRDLYYGALVGMDRQFGVLFETIRSSATLRNNTLIVVCSDNGPEPGAGSAGPFRGHKGNLYEGGIRSPLIVWGPGIVPGTVRGSVDRDSVITAVDFAPSLLALAGVTRSNDVTFDGIDRSASLIGKAPATRSQPMFWIRPPDRPGEQGQRWPDLAVRDGNWKFLIHEDGSGAELYDLLNDRRETTNIAKQHRAIVERLTQAVGTWRKSIPAFANTGLGRKPK